MGIGIGAKNATVPIYSAEMAPARIRGALVMFWQLWVVIGKSPGLLNLSLVACRCGSNFAATYPACPHYMPASLAKIMKKRYFPRLLRERHCQGCGRYRLAT